MTAIYKTHKISKQSFHQKLDRQMAIEEEKEKARDEEKKKGWIVMREM